MSVRLVFMSESFTLELDMSNVVSCRLRSRLRSRSRLSRRRCREEEHLRGGGSFNDFSSSELLLLLLLLLGRYESRRCI